MFECLKTNRGRKFKIRRQAEEANIYLAILLLDANERILVPMHEAQ